MSKFEYEISNPPLRFTFVVLGPRLSVMGLPCILPAELSGELPFRMKGNSSAVDIFEPHNA